MHGEQHGTHFNSMETFWNSPTQAPALKLTCYAGSVAEQQQHCSASSQIQRSNQITDTVSIMLLVYAEETAGSSLSQGCKTV